MPSFWDKTALDCGSPPFGDFGGSFKRAVVRGAVNDMRLLESAKRAFYFHETRFLAYEYVVNYFCVYDLAASEA